MSCTVGGIVMLMFGGCVISLFLFPLRSKMTYYSASQCIPYEM
jgi:hypothetical protein